MPNEKKIDLVEFVKDAVNRDNVLREKYLIGDKFRFVRDQLHALLDQLEKHANVETTFKKKEAAGLAEDEAMVFIYLFNAGGLVVPSWAKMLTPKLLSEYGVNRPIYGEKVQIDSLVRSKVNRMQHAYISIAVNKNNILPTELKDSVGGSLIRVREGGLIFNRLIAFSHNDIDYKLNEDGLLVKKNLD
jgi:hypothetical protein